MRSQPPEHMGPQILWLQMEKAPFLGLLEWGCSLANFSQILHAVFSLHCLSTGLEQPRCNQSKLVDVQQPCQIPQEGTSPVNNCSQLQVEDHSFFPLVSMKNGKKKRKIMMEEWLLTGWCR